MNNYCTICNEYFTDIDKHIKEKHNRHNVSKNAVVTKSRLEEYKIHYDKYNTEDIYKELDKKADEEASPFWTSAKSKLNEDDYRKLKEYVNDGEKSISGYTRNSRFGRYSRAVEGNKTNS